MSTHAHYDETIARLRQKARRIGRTLKDLPRMQHSTQDALSKKPYRVLSTPLVTLYVSPANPQLSEKAFQTLAGSRTAFSVEESADGTVSAKFAGKCQHGIEGVQKLSDALSAARDILLDSGMDIDAELERRYVPGYREQAESELNEYLNVARDDLDCILSNSGLLTAQH